MPQTNDPPLITSRAQTREVVAHREAARTGILLVNLGTPEAPTPKALRAYLKQFLGDPRVIEVPRPIWWFILNGIILPFRAPRSARAYASVWTEQGSPLMTASRELADALHDKLQTNSDRLEVILAMTYGQPSIDAAVEQLRDRNIQRLLVLPMYPQYSATTTAPIFDQLTRALRRLRWLPELRFINDYYREDGWVDAIADSIRSFQIEHGKPEKLLFSFHGIPKKYLQLGDPYHCQCRVSARRITERLGLADDSWELSFQSRLGRAEWLKPYTDKTLERMAGEGIRNVQVICPGFSIDCLETLEEIAMEGREEFIEAGGERLDYIPCLNAGSAHVRFLARLCYKHGQGWPDFDGVRPPDTAELEARVERADRVAERLNLD